jgi:NADH-quinone oxidoreductase subunit I
MTKAYDYSEYDIRNMVYQFADLTTEEAQAKRKEWDDAQAEKLKAKETKVEVTNTPEATSSTSDTTTSTPAPVKKVFIPKVAVPKKPVEEPQPETSNATEAQQEDVAPKEEIKKAVPPKIKIAIPKKIIKKDDDTNASNQTESES